MALCLTLLVSLSISAENTIPDKDAQLAKETPQVEINTHFGTVISAETAGKYTYIKLEEDGQEIWIATLPSLLKTHIIPGGKIEYAGGIAMTNFKSKGMNRTFESILFVSKIRSLQKTEQIPADEYHKNIKAAKDIKAAPVSAIEPAVGEIEKAKDGKTVMEIIRDSDSLKDKEVVLRAKAMKINRNILKKNWITVKDGSGKSPDDKILILTTDDAQTNDILTVKGTVKTNVDIGAGYTYKVLIDQAEIIKK
jgi:hypothetical protein